MNPSDDDWLAFGIELGLRTTEDGGRTKPLALDGYRTFEYRPNWRLPGMRGTNQVGAPVFWFGRHPVLPGDTVRAVIVPSAPGGLQLWQQLRTGDVITMLEGSRDCGSATVHWIEHTQRHLSPAEEDAFKQRAATGAWPNADRNDE